MTRATMGISTSTDRDSLIHIQMKQAMPLSKVRPSRTRYDRISANWPSRKSHGASWMHMPMRRRNRSNRMTARTSPPKECARRLSLFQTMSAHLLELSFMRRGWQTSRGELTADGSKMIWRKRSSAAEIPGRREWIPRHLVSPGEGKIPDFGERAKRTTGSKRPRRLGSGTSRRRRLVLSSHRQATVTQLGLRGTRIMRPLNLLHGSDSRRDQNQMMTASVRQNRTKTR